MAIKSGYWITSSCGQLNYSSLSLKFCDVLVSIYSNVSLVSDCLLLGAAALLDSNVTNNCERKYRIVLSLISLLNEHVYLANFSFLLKLHFKSVLNQSIFTDP